MKFEDLRVGQIVRIKESPKHFLVKHAGSILKVIDGNPGGEKFQIEWLTEAADWEENLPMQVFLFPRAAADLELMNGIERALMRME